MGWIRLGIAEEEVIDTNRLWEKGVEVYGARK